MALKLIAQKIISKYHPVLIGVLNDDGGTGIKGALASVLETKFAVRKSRFSDDVNYIYERILGIDESEIYYALFFKIIPLLFFKDNFPNVIILEFDISDKESVKKIAASGLVFDFLVLGSLFSSNGKLTDLRNLLKSADKQTKIVINKDDKNLAKLIGEGKTEYLTYSTENKDASVYALALQEGDTKWLMQNGKIGIAFKICVGANTMPVRLDKVIGKDYVAPAVASYAVGMAMGLNLVEISQALEKYGGVQGKMNLLSGIKNTLVIDDSRAATCDSVREAVSIFKKLAGKRKIAVVGDILALGKETEKFHRQIGKAFYSAGTDLLVVVGERAVFVKDGAIKAGLAEDKIFVYDKEEMGRAAIFIQNKMKEDDVVFVGGSREIGMEKVVEEIRAGGSEEKGEE